MPEVPVAKNSKFKALKKVDFKVVAIVVLAAILLLTLFWHPWVKTFAANSRTIQVTGTGSVKSTPDEFVFYPSYSSANADKQAATAELAKKSDEIVTKLKTLGVTDEMIKTNASSNDGKYMLTTMYPIPGDTSSTLQITVTVNSRELAQKVQDYLGTTGPTAAVSPTPNFSAAKQKQLQNQARDEAAKDAKDQANQMAKNLGFKLGAVKTVEDQVGLMGRGGIMPMSATATDAGGVTTIGSAGGMGAGAVTVESGQAMAVPATGAVSISSDGVKAAQLSVMPGQDEVTYSVNVVYYVK